MDAAVPFRGRVVAEAFDRDLAHARHDPHAEHDINGIGDFEADFGQRRIGRPHHVRHDEQSATAHRALKQALQFCIRLARFAPVVGRAGFFFGRRTDESELLHPSDVVRI